MMKLIQKRAAFAFLLAFVLIAAVLPAVHAAEELFTADGLGYRITEDENGDACVKITSYTGTEPELTIPSELDGLPVTSIASYAFEDCTVLTSVTIPNGVNDIGYSVFRDCTNLVRVVLPDGITRLDYTFEGCTRLTDVVIPESVTRIGQCVFDGCRSLTAITIPDGVTQIGYGSFLDCAGLTSIRLPKSLVFMERHVFLRCSSLAEILVDEENEKFSSREGILYNKDQTALVQAPGALSGTCTIPQGVTTIQDSAFRELNHLTWIILPETVREIEEWAFYGCENLEYIDLPVGITHIRERTFSFCDRLTEIQLPWTVRFIERDAFTGCSGLTSIEIPTAVKKIDSGAFWGCKALESISFLGNAPAIHWDSFQNVTAVCYYSGEYEGWTEAAMVDYGGSLTWVDSENIHVHDYSIDITPPTCLEWGYTTYTCDCGYSYMDQKTFFTGHSLGEWSVYRQPSCTQRGEERNVCSDCSYYESRLLEMEAHRFVDGICQVCGCDQASAMQIVDVTDYSYTVTPILSPFAYYLYVQTDNPDPRSFRLVDREITNYDPDDVGGICIPANYGYNYVKTEPGTYCISQQSYLDVVYEDESIHRVPGGYIFCADDDYSDGGELILQQQTKVGNNISGDEFRDTDVVIPCQKLYTDFSYLIEHYTDPELSLFENLDQVNAYIRRYAVYPRSVYNVSKPNEGRRYPMLVSAYYPELPLDCRYTSLFEELKDSLLMSEAYPFILDSLSYPWLIAKVAETLAPECTVESTGVHYIVEITYNGESRTYGGAGAGGNDPLYSNRVEKLFAFSGEPDCATNGTLDSYCKTLLGHEAAALADNAQYADFVDGETFEDTIRRSGSTWAMVATEGGFGYGTSFAYLMWDGDSVVPLTNTWVDGRYIGIHERIVLRAVFEDYPTADILLHDVTYTNYYGATVTGDVLYEYDAERDVWESYDAYTGGWYSSGLVLPEELILTQEEVAVLSLDDSSSKWPVSGLIYDGTVPPGTPFTHNSVTEIKLTEAIMLCEGEEAVLELQVLPADADDPRVEWSVADRSIVEIVSSEKCMICGIAEGTTQITVTTIDGAYSAVCQVTVLDACAKGHSFGNYVSDGNATCTEDGTKTAVCSICGVTDSVVDEGSALGHSFTIYLSDCNASCTLDGTKTAVCDRCAATDTVTDEGSALGHDFTEWIEIQAPTVLEEGMEFRYCRYCGAEEIRSVAKLGNPFTDVSEDTFYYEPVLWAIEKGITNGTSPTTFGSNDPCMRAHVVTFLWRAAGEPEPASAPNPFVDVKETDFFYKAVLWAVENGITNGLDATHFGPTAYCNRAQVVTFLYRTLESPETETIGNPFTDVEAGSFYEKPVLWAVENGITNGVSDTAFAPDTICNRAQIVTFLYRAFSE